MNFFDFQIRAWLVDSSYVQVLVHNSPVGDMSRPVTVPFDKAWMDTFRKVLGDRWVGSAKISLQDLIEGGLQLSGIILPPPVFSLLNRSLERIDREDGLRLRLCLDESLIDLPWEYLYRPDAISQNSWAGFLALDSRCCLVREAPRTAQKLKPPSRKQRLLFAGTPFIVKGRDHWQISVERELLTDMLTPVSETLFMDAITISQVDFESAFSKRVDIFHYVGHTDEVNGRGYLLQDIRTSPPDHPNYQVLENPGFRSIYGSDRLYLDPFYSESLGGLLRRAGTKLAVFSACNSGRWQFVEPLIRAGVPVVIGTQGSVMAWSSAAFCQKLYSALVLGLSLEEAVTWARFHLLDPGVAQSEEAWAWGLFMVYMPTSDAILFPKPAQREMRKRQEAARQARAQTIINVYQNIGTVEGGQVIGISAGQIGGK